ncbi:MAG TPA: universal stress protein [Jatrophihabitans sp.]|nr:universal stress protein [Jatrophihabitans sp.]
MNGILVGLGTDDANTELDWAAAEAQTRGARLQVVRTYHVSEGARPWLADTDKLILEDRQRAAERRVAEAVSYLTERWPGVEVTAEAVKGLAEDVLIDRSADAAVTVLGSRQLGRFGAAAHGSVSTVVAAAAHGPVVVVSHPGAATGTPGSVIVGVDGSPREAEVLGFAFDYASRHHRPLNAVYCWRPDLLATSKWRGEPPPPERAVRWLAETVAGWQEKYPDVALQRGVVRDHPVAGLVAASEGQDLLVVGSRSRHARVAALLGSVSQGVLHHAACPVAIIHPGADGVVEG